MYHQTVKELIEAWDKGETIWTIEMGGLGPGYEQAIQIAAVEMARAGQHVVMTGDKEKDGAAWREVCDAALAKIDKDLGGLTGAMYYAASHLAFQWCHGDGPAGLIKRYENEGQGERVMQCNKGFPKAPEHHTV